LGVAKVSVNGTGAGVSKSYESLSAKEWDKALVDARVLGLSHGENAAGWVIQDSWGGRAGRNANATAAAFLKGYEDGDPAIMDSVKTPDLSGEYSGDMTPPTLYAQIGLGGDFEDTDDMELAQSYEDGASEAFRDTLVQSAKAHLESQENPLNHAESKKLFDLSHADYMEANLEPKGSLRRSRFKGSAHGFVRSLILTSKQKIVGKDAWALREKIEALPNPPKHYGYQKEKEAENPKKIYPDGIKAIYDNGGKTADRYTVYYMEHGSKPGFWEGVGMSEHPFDPQGFGQHTQGMLGSHNGKRIEFSQLPPDAQKLVMRDLGEGWNEGKTRPLGNPKKIYPDGIKAIYDNGGKTADRYTVYYMEHGSKPGFWEGVGMSEHPFHPQGFGQHTEGMLGSHNGKLIEFSQLPPDAQKLVMRDLGEGWNEGKARPLGNPKKIYPDGIKAIYDNGGKTADRYTVYYMEHGSKPGFWEGVGMSEHPFHPQGFGQHTEGMLGSHNGKLIEFSQLPPDAQKVVMRDLGEGWNEGKTRPLGNPARNKGMDSAARTARLHPMQPHKVPYIKRWKLCDCGGVPTPLSSEGMSHFKKKIKKILSNPPMTLIGRKCLEIKMSGGFCEGNFGSAYGMADGSAFIKGVFTKVPGGKVKSILYLDEAKAKREGLTPASRPWKHDFSSLDAKAVRVKGGLVIKSKTRLWENR
jgi:hypothetical protein